MVSLGLAGVPPTQALAIPAAEWPQFRGGPTHQGSDQPSTITPANVSTLDWAWYADLGTVVSSPAVVGGVVYVGSVDHKLYAFDAAGAINCGGTPKTCEPLWTALTEGDVFSTPAVAGGVVYVGSDDGILFAFDAAGLTNCSGTPTTCGPLWTTPTGAAIQTSPAIVNGVVYVGSNGAVCGGVSGVRSEPPVTQPAGRSVGRRLPAGCRPRPTRE